MYSINHLLHINSSDSLSIDTIISFLLEESNGKVILRFTYNNWIEKKGFSHPVIYLGAFYGKFKTNM